MYEIRKGDSVIALSEKPNYIRRVDGCYCLCSEQEAQGVAVAGTPYRLHGNDELPDLDAVIVVERDGGEIIKESEGRVDALEKDRESQAAAYREGVNMA